jgi:hypothetical protein
VSTGVVPEDADPDETATADSQPLDEVDWSALWVEFGCSQDDYISRTQLEGAVSVTEQDVAGSLPALNEPSQEAVPDGLIAQWTRDADAATTLRGFYLQPEVRDDG